MPSSRISTTRIASTSIAPPPAPGARSAHRFARVEVPRRRPATRTACTNCRRNKKRCEPSACELQSSSCVRCLEGGLECAREPWPVVRARAHPRRRASAPAPGLGPVPFVLPPDDEVPGILPEVPLRGTDPALLRDLLAWRAELNAATLACSNAAADHQATKAKLRLAVTLELNASVHSSIALERRRTAWERYLQLLGAASPNMLSPSSSVASVSSSPGGKGKARASPAAEDADDEFYDDIFEGISVDLGNGGTQSAI